EARLFTYDDLDRLRDADLLLLPIHDGEPLPRVVLIAQFFPEDSLRVAQILGLGQLTAKNIIETVDAHDGVVGVAVIVASQELPLLGVAGVLHPRAGNTEPRGIRSESDRNARLRVKDSRRQRGRSRFGHIPRTGST